MTNNKLLINLHHPGFDLLENLSANPAKHWSQEVNIPPIDTLFIVDTVFVVDTVLIVDTLSITQSSNQLSQLIIPAAAVIVSIFALTVTFISLKIQRTHNKKSVRPAGAILLSDSKQELHVRIVNKGVGPMLVKEFTATRDNTVEHNIVYHLPDKILEGHTHQIYTEPEDRWLLPGDELTLLRLKGNDKDKIFIDTREKIRSILSKITVRLVICDVYDEEHPAFEKTLKWFNRGL